MNNQFYDYLIIKQIFEGEELIDWMMRNLKIKEPGTISTR